MPSVTHVPREPLSRRTFLRGAGVALALPALDAMRPVFGTAARAAEGQSAIPRRMLCIQTNQGILPRHFFPKDAGRDYTLSPYLEILKQHREQFTVFSGVSLPDVDGGHEGEISFLTGAPHPLSASFRNTISLDQLAAESIGTRTRFPFMTLATGPTSRSLSFSRNGVMIPPENSPASIYRQIFVQGNPAEIAARLEDLRRGRSLLDFVGDRARRMQRDLGPADRARIDQYFTAVRGLERQLEESAAWETRPKPKASAPEPVDRDLKDSSILLEQIPQMYDVIRLALESDSTRLITLYLSYTTPPLKLPGVTVDTHNLSHHGGSEDALRQLEIIERAGLQKLDEFLTGLSTTREEGQTLLDRTMVLFGAGMGDANTHSNMNMPMLLAGGGFKHGRHLAFDTSNNYNLASLYVSMLQRLGIEADTFASAKATMKGLEMA